MANKDLFREKLEVINLGLSSFQETIASTEAEVVQVDWRPPAAVDEEVLQLISGQKSVIEKKNREAIERILKGAPVLIDLQPALEVIPGMKENMILHAGPPIAWRRMCGPMRGAIIGALIYEGKAADKEEAEKLAASGEIEYSPCHEHRTVGPMAGIVSPTMPVFVLKNETYNNRAYCTMNEGLGKVLRYGAFSPEVVKKLKWMEQNLYPVLKAAVKELGKIDLKNIMAQALHMGDEVHNRNRAATSLFYRTVAPSIIKTAAHKQTAIDVLKFINGNDHFFLNLSMPACKVTLDAARNIDGSSIVVALTRNGTDFGIQLAGTGEQWFVGEAPLPDALFFAGYTKDDANRDIGDSSITETNGLGGFTIASSPAIVQFVGGSVQDSINYSNQMYEITAAENNVYQIPALNFRGSPTGIDVRKVVEKGMTPFIDTGVAHKEPGVGQVGAGVLSAPMQPFIQAMNGLAKQFASKK